MWLLSRDEAKKLDQSALASGIAETSLIQKAGVRSAALIAELLPPAARVLVLCGPGNNGADGAVAAHELSRRGFSVEVLAFKDLASVLGGEKSYGAYVDALFGIGLNRHFETSLVLSLAKINAAAGIKISLDIPSGLDADTGNSWGAIFKADHTLTVERPKPGFYLNLGPEHCGKIHLVREVFESGLVKRHAHSVFLLSRKLVQRWIPVRRATDSKTRGGKTLILAGQSEMPGAATLASTAAARVGAGYVYVSDKEFLKDRPEFLLWDQKDFAKFSAVLIGPGFGVNEKTKKLLMRLRKTQLPVVVDADAITVLSQMKNFATPENWILTPHAGELSRLIDLSSKDIESDRLNAARLAQKKWGCVIVLKGFHTVVACKEVSVIVPTGNAALGKAGSGDVLAGMIAGFLSQGLSPERASMLACYAHGLMADQWLACGKDVLSLQPSDLLKQLPQTLARLRRF
jgi:NAD(P)H-hydrate epimerase